LSDIDVVTLIDRRVLNNEDSEGMATMRPQIGRRHFALETRGDGDRTKREPSTRPTPSSVRMCPSGLTALLALFALVGTTEASAQPELRVYTADQEASHLFIVTGRSGLLGFLGHDHSILAREWRAELCMGDPIPPGSHGTLVIGTHALEIDSDSALALAGIGRSPSDDDIAELQEKMLSSEYLAAEDHPLIRLEATTMQEGGDGDVQAVGAITVRGITREIEVPVRLQDTGGDAVRLSGTVTVRHTDFGIEPESIFRVVRVADPVALNFVITALPTTERCEALPPR
jgi:hypothetical protein